MGEIEPTDTLASFFMALADGTRLRLLNLMREGEVCVCFFTEVLGLSQPKVSRHLAYLRNAEIVGARRDGKWMHYRILPQENDGRRQILENLLDALYSRQELKAEYDRYRVICSSPDLLVQIARTPMDFTVQRTDDKEHPDSMAAHNEIEEFLL